MRKSSPRSARATTSGCQHRRPVGSHRYLHLLRAQSVNGSPGTMSGKRTGLTQKAQSKKERDSPAPRIKTNGASDADQKGVMEPRNHFACEMNGQAAWLDFRAATAGRKPWRFANEELTRAPCSTVLAVACHWEHPGLSCPTSPRLARCRRRFYPPRCRRRCQAAAHRNPHRFRCRRARQRPRLQNRAPARPVLPRTRPRATRTTPLPGGAAATLPRASTRR